MGDAETVTARDRDRGQKQEICLKLTASWNGIKGSFHARYQLVRRWRTLRRAQMSSKKERPNV